eukprot:10440360-Alexandrium_andersonii.AAC.1
MAARALARTARGAGATTVVIDNYLVCRRARAAVEGRSFIAQTRPLWELFRSLGRSARLQIVWVPSRDKRP